FTSSASANLATHLKHGQGKEGFNARHESQQDSTQLKVHAGFSTTLPSCQTITGSLSARFWAMMFCAARRKARSARATKAGAFRCLEVRCSFCFTCQPTFAQIQYHGRMKLRVVLPAGCGCPKSPSALQ